MKICTKIDNTKKGSHKVETPNKHNEDRSNKEEDQYSQKSRRETQTHNNKKGDPEYSGSTILRVKRLQE